MSNESFHVAIIGGLCLAQGLSKAGVSTAKGRHRHVENVDLARSDLL
jgi:hypothetical protein